MKNILVFTSIFLITCSGLVSQVSAAKRCQRKTPIRYQITRTQKRVEPRYTSAIQNDFKDAVSIHIRESISALRNGMLKLDENIQELFANGIGLKQIEPGVFDSQKIDYHLHLDNNLLTVIRKGTFKNLGVTILDLFSNKITTLEDGAIDNLQSLTTLNLFDNQIVQFSAKSIINTRKVFLFDLSFNRLRSLPQQNTFPFMMQDQPVHLLLEDNQLSELNPNAFGSLMGFRTLNLTNNRLTTLHGVLFRRYLLGSVLIANNSLTTLPEEFFTQLTKNSGMYMLYDLKMNSFSCDVQGRLAEFRNRTSVNVLFDGSEECTNPDILVDTVSNYFNLAEFRK